MHEIAQGPNGNLRFLARFLEPTSSNTGCLDPLGWLASELSKRSCHGVLAKPRDSKSRGCHAKGNCKPWGDCPYMPIPGPPKYVNNDLLGHCWCLWALVLHAFGAQVMRVPMLLLRFKIRVPS